MRVFFEDLRFITYLNFSEISEALSLETPFKY